MKEGDTKSYYDSILQAEAYRIQLFSDLNQSAYNTLENKELYIIPSFVKYPSEPLLFM